MRWRLAACAGASSAVVLGACIGVQIGTSSAELEAGQTVLSTSMSAFVHMACHWQACSPAVCTEQLLLAARLKLPLLSRLQACRQLCQHDSTVASLGLARASLVGLPAMRVRRCSQSMLAPCRRPAGCHPARQLRRHACSTPSQPLRVWTVQLLCWRGVCSGWVPGQPAPGVPAMVPA